MNKEEKEFNVEELEENPILKPFSEYYSKAMIFEDTTKKEAEYLKRSKKEIDELLKTGILEDSTIARTYQRVVEILERLLWAATTNIDLAENKIEEMKKNVEKYYIPIKDHKEKIKKYENEIKEIKEKLVGLEDKKELSKDLENFEQEVEESNKPEEGFEDIEKPKIKPGRPKNV